MRIMPELSTVKGDVAGAPENWAMGADDSAVELKNEIMSDGSVER